uniref:Clathrin heavy chain n=1 Tax=Heterorhabditis bacteriophora TaxID=37862 RepID=A0A1I7WB81_HETBA
MTFAIGFDRKILVVALYFSKGCFQVCKIANYTSVTLVTFREKGDIVVAVGIISRDGQIVCCDLKLNVIRIIIVKEYQHLQTSRENVHYEFVAVVFVAQYSWPRPRRKSANISGIMPVGLSIEGVYQNHVLLGTFRVFGAILNENVKISMNFRTRVAISKTVNSSSHIVIPFKE